MRLRLMICLAVVAVAQIARAESNLSFEQCAALNSGDVAQFMASRVSQGGHEEKNIYVRKGDDLSVSRANTNDKLEITWLLGFQNEPGSQVRVSTRASGETHSEEFKVDYGIGLSEILDHPGAEVYDTQVFYRRDDNPFKSGPKSRNKITVSERQEVVLSGCKIPAVKITIVKGNKATDFNAAPVSWNEVTYLPTLRYTATSSYFTHQGGKTVEKTVFKTVDIEPK